jgi:hypothetical protein
MFLQQIKAITELKNDCQDFLNYITLQGFHMKTNDIFPLK